LKDHKPADTIVQFLAVKDGVAALSHAMNSRIERQSTLYSTTGYRVTFFHADAERPNSPPGTPRI
jgi:hypothetical protein